MKQGDEALWTVLSSVVQNKQKCTAIGNLIKNLWQKKMEQICFDSSALVCLDICTVHILIWTPCISFKPAQE